MAETININTYPIEETIAVTTVEDVTTVNVNIIQSTGAVTSVNEQTGDVVLTPSNIGALAVDGSNASTNVDLGGYNLDANELTSQNRISSNGYYLINSGSGQVGLYATATDELIAILDTSADKVYKYANGNLTYNETTNELKWGSNVIATLTDLPDLSSYATTSELATGLSGKENTVNSGTTSQYYRGDKSWQALDKSAVGLGNVDNTSDTSKPVSTAQQTALNLKLNKGKYITTGYTQVTGVSTTTVIASMLIPANTYASGETFEIIITPNKSVTAVAIAVNVYHSTSVNGTTNAICTAVSLSTTQRVGYLQRVLTIDGTTLRNSMPVSASGITPVAGIAVGTTTTFNPAVDNWITLTMNPSVVSETVGFNNLTVRPV